MAGWCALGALALLLLLPSVIAHVWVVAVISLLVLLVAGIRAWSSFTGIWHVGKAR